VGAIVPALSDGVGGGAEVAAKGGPVQRKDGARHAAGRTAAVVVDHAEIRDGMCKWRSCLWSGDRF
jgi:hypothetical protein